MTLQSMKQQIQGKHIQVLSDNVTTVAYINHMGGPSKELSDLMSTIWAYIHSIGDYIMCQTSGRDTEAKSRTEQIGVPIRLVPAATGISNIGENVGSPHSRSICCNAQFTVGQIQQSLHGPRVRRSRCVSTAKLEIQEKFLQPPVLPDSKNIASGDDTRSGSNINSSLVAKSTMVSETDPDDDRHTIQDQKFVQSNSQPESHSRAIKKSQMEIVCMEDLRKKNCNHKAGLQRLLRGSL